MTEFDFWTTAIAMGVMAAIVLCIMRLNYVIKISWLWITSPFWIPFTILCGFYCCGAIIWGLLLTMIASSVQAEKFEKEKKEKDEDDED